MESTHVVVGALARVDVVQRTAVRQHLEDIEGVSTFDLAAREKLGVLIDAHSLDAAHATLTGPVRRTPGVLGVWPVAIETDD